MIMGIEQKQTAARNICPSCPSLGNIISECLPRRGAQRERAKKYACQLLLDQNIQSAQLFEYNPLDNEKPAEEQKGTYHREAENHGEPEQNVL